MAVAVPPRRNRRSPTPPRILTAVPLCDGHDSAVMTVNHELVRHGAEVVYLGYHQSAAAIARAAVQEDVDAVGISSYNGGHLVFFREVLAELRARSGADIPVFGGGGGTITAADARLLQRAGVARIFFAGTPLAAMVDELFRHASTRRRLAAGNGDRALGRAISLAENESSAAARAHATSRRVAPRSPFVLGVAGPGGAGKSTLIDELTARFLHDQRAGRLAILANDPSQPGSGGALLGDRVAAIYAQNDRVFFRSLGTRGAQAGRSAALPGALQVLRERGGFDLIIVESVGIGQESDPFGTLGRDERALVDAVLFVLPPHYGGRIQLEKTALLHGADFVALNKCDDPRCGTARAELAASLVRDTPPPALHLTTAARHDDPGVDQLYAAIAARAGLSPPGGERPCLLCVET
ncbi:cobalamin-dependent protein [Opitutus sp. ER46]|uniref:cobalamin-dependent protein n=1 Tax=Opitutus sp. ER46 TaxID=2161864 RepID=UPI0013049CC6|nr:cobalamin-dependent protein [Opitutus sp. ER46]